MPVQTPTERVDAPALPSVLQAEPVHEPPKRHGRVFLFCGVILPLVALLFETTTHYCAQHFFDPFPSTAHILLYLLIPVSNFLTWLAGRRDLSSYYLFISLANGMAMGIGCLYTLMFLPISGLSAMYILFFGFGLLGLAPLLSLPASWLAGKSVCGMASSKRTFFDPHMMEHIGHLIILVMVVAIELPSTLTRYNLGAANDHNPKTAAQAVAWLRKYGSQEVMLRACYERSGRATDILGALAEHMHPISQAEARATFYKVTGKPFNSVPIPASARATIKNTGIVSDSADLNAGVQDDFDYDADIAGESVSGAARGLMINDAKMSGKIDGNAAQAYVTWSFKFDNSSPFDREARCKILLPPGGVVTKAVMRVNGVPHYATIMARTEARTVYQEAVKERKNPLLISVCGDDQILVQCFPVRKGTDIELSFDIAAPMTVAENRDSASLVLPAFVERNFETKQPVQVDFTSADSTLTAPGNKEIVSTASELSGRVDTAQLSRFQAIVHATRDPNVEAVFARDTRSGYETYIKRLIRREAFVAPTNLTVVIDGSEPMKNYLPEIVQGLEAISPAVSVEIMLVGDEVKTLCSKGTKPGDAKFREALTALRDFVPVGGQDDRVIATAVRKAYKDKGSAVLWIHAAQPLAKHLSGAVQLALKHGGTRPLLYDLQVATGANEYLNFPEKLPSLIRVVRTGSVAADMKRLYGAWKEKPRTEEEFTWDPAPIVGSASLVKADDTLGQLWAFNQILKLTAPANADDPNNAAQAAAYANNYHLVTPISSGIVVEDIQLLAGNIDPPAPLEVPDLREVLANFGPLGGIRDSLSASFEKATQELNRLNSSGDQVETMTEETPPELESPPMTEAAPPELAGATNGTVGSRGQEGSYGAAPNPPQAVAPGIQAYSTRGGAAGGGEMSVFAPHSSNYTSSTTRAVDGAMPPPVLKGKTGSPAGNNATLMFQFDGRAKEASKKFAPGTNEQILNLRTTARDRESAIGYGSYRPKAVDQAGLPAFNKVQESKQQSQRANRFKFSPSWESEKAERRSEFDEFSMLRQKNDAGNAKDFSDPMWRADVNARKQAAAETDDLGAADDPRSGEANAIGMLAQDKPYSALQPLDVSTVDLDHDAKYTQSRVFFLHVLFAVMGLVGLTALAVGVLKLMFLLMANANKPVVPEAVMEAAPSRRRVMQ